MSSYEVEHIGPHTLYRGDCLDILPSLPPVMALITDPPYGTGWVRGGGRCAGSFQAQTCKAAWDEWDLKYLDLLQAEYYAIFCPDNKIASLGALHSIRLRYYIKSNPRPPLGSADSPSVEPIVIWPRVRFGKGPAHKIAYNGDAQHPCQKPLSILLWLVRGLAQAGERVCDPFCGSGTTNLAALMLGCPSIGIEREHEYFDIACQRMHAAMAQPDLFIAQAQPATQQPLFGDTTWPPNRGQRAREDRAPP